MAVSNPTTIHKKVSTLFEWGAHIICLAETSATNMVQQQITKEFKPLGFQSFWSPPAPPKKETIDDRPSLRGDALGTAIFSMIPARKLRLDIPLTLHSTVRFNAAVLRMGSSEVLVACVYGFATRVVDGIHLNDLLVAAVFDVIQKAGLPFIVCGDFNQPLSSIPAFKAFQAMGCVEAFQFAKMRFQDELAPTCRGITKNDTAILHPNLLPFVTGFQVDKSFELESHTPLFIDFDFSIQAQDLEQWRIPKGWAAIIPAGADLAESYSSPFGSNSAEGHQCINVTTQGQVHEALKSWSHACEVSVHKALLKAHFQDSLKAPLKGLPKQYWGRMKCNRCNVSDSSAPKYASHSYNPPSEVFTIASKHKVKQVRRLRTLAKSMAKLNLEHPDNSSSFRSARLQWIAIREASGYGRSWHRWLLSFECIREVPDDLPTLDQLHDFCQLTELDCQATCQQEANRRAASFKHRIQIDHSDNFAKLTYHLVRGTKTAEVQDIPVYNESIAKLLRNSSGLPRNPRIQITDNVPFSVFGKATFGTAVVKILSQHNRILEIQVLSGSLPAQGLLCQHTFAVTHHEIFQHFNRFWEPYWCRDNPVEQFEDDTWESFLQEFDAAGMPQLPPVSIDVGDTSLWQCMIRQLRDGKAAGICGWRHEELKVLPASAITDLASVFAQVCQTGFGPALMLARTMLLPKKDDLKGLGDIRPITILSVLYRLFGKLIFRCVTRAWVQHFPKQISGGLPFRGVKDLAFLQKSDIERSLQAGTQLGGFSLDLIKAFNTFGRRPFVHLFRRLGVPSWVCQFWITSLSNMRRMPQLGSDLGDPIHSTTGLPEGCCLSVLGMLALSFMFFCRLRTTLVLPYGYADNWSWVTTILAEQRQAFIKMLNLTCALRVMVDFSKSWAWGNTKEFREGCKLLQLFFPDLGVSIQILEHVKDLGEVISYNRRHFVDFIKDKVQNACQRIRRLRHIPCTVQQKCRIIQTSAFPLALYAADSNYIGPSHFDDLRRAIVFAFIGARGFASPFMAPFALSKFLDDPFLVILYTIACQVRRLYKIDAPLARQFLALACSDDATYTFGPAGSFRRYLDHVGLSMNPDGTIFLSPFLRCNVLHDSSKAIKESFRTWWPRFLVNEVNRKGIGECHLHARLSAQCFAALPDAHQKLLLHNMLGAFQSETIKARWDKSIEGKCPLCDAQDSRYHRLLECSALNEVRMEFPDAVSILMTDRPDWIYFPLAQACPDQAVFDALVQALPETSPPQPVDVDRNVITFFTDGGALHTTDCLARLAGFSVVQDTSPDEAFFQASADFAFLRPPSFPSFRTLATGIVPGPQNVPRAELYAFVLALQASFQCTLCTKFCFVTDASYVMGIVTKIESHNPTINGPGSPNQDLIQIVQTLWNPDRHSIQKVKSHRSFDSATDIHDLYLILGNHCADVAASAALQAIPQVLSEAAQVCAAFHVQEKIKLQKVLAYLIAHNISRTAMLKHRADQAVIGAPLPPIQNARMPKHLFGQDAVAFLTSYHDPAYVPFTTDPMPTEYILQACQQGSRLAFAIISWCQSLKWPVGLAQEYSEKDDWGISWFELWVNFYLTTGMAFPMRLSGLGAKSVYLPYFSSESHLQPPSKRAVSQQAFVFQKALNQICTISQIQWFPTFKHACCSSPKHLNYLSKAAGIPCRPLMPRQAETMLAIQQFLRCLSGKSSLSNPFPNHHVTPMFDIPQLVELSVEERFRRYNQVYQENYVVRRGG
eukprot:Skav210047  [mRNA]  locus=scaffold706:505896:511097:- [translate_table: standard]